MIKQIKSMETRLMWLAVGLVGLTISLYFSMVTTVFAEITAVDDVIIDVPVSCTLSGVDAEHTDTIINGTYKQNIGTTVLRVLCNDSDGFAIYAAGYTGEEIGGENSTKLVGANNIGNIVTGVAKSGNTSNWAMKLATDTTATYPVTILSDTDGSYASESYHVIPAEFTKVAVRNGSTDIGAAATGSVLTTTYQAYIAPTQPTGVYTGKVIYALVHPGNAPAPVICNAEATTITEAKCLQDFANAGDTNRAAIVGSMVLETQYTLKDSRDGKNYTIAKLADGNVWMTQNLDLDLVAGVTYTNEDTDIGYNAQTGEYETAAWSPVRSTYATSNSQTTTWCNGGTWNTQSGHCISNNTPESYDPGDLYWNTTTSDLTDWNAYRNTCDYSTSTPSCSGTNPIGTYTSSTGTTQYHLGNYYNWPAAVAMNDSSSYTTLDELIERSICPAGWTLPRVGDGEDTFQALWEEYGWDENNGLSNISTIWSAPLYFPASGAFDGMLYYVGGTGSFWSPVVYDSNIAREAGFNANKGAYPLSDDGRSYGYSIRCVARPVAD